VVTKKANPTARIFAVKADLGIGDEVALHDVLTWRKLSDAEAFCKSGKAGVSSRVVIAERGSSFEGGMSMTVGEKGVWSVQLENDRMVSPLKEGEVLSVLESDYALVGKARLWQLRARVIGHLLITNDDVRYVDGSLGVPKK
jgi:hypothetical protein